MKAVVLADSPGTQQSPLSSFCPPLGFMVIDRPLLTHLLSALGKVGVTEVVVAASADAPCDLSVVRTRLNGSNVGVDVSWVVQNPPRGTAGALKDLEGFLDSPEFLVISGNVFVEAETLREIIAYHGKHGGSATVGVERRAAPQDDLESIELDTNGAVSRCRVLHSSMNLRQPTRPCGVYVFDRAVLSHVCNLEYTDINEQLLPRLYENGHAARPHELNGSTHRIDTPSDYLELNSHLLAGGLRDPSAVFDDYTPLTDRIWIGKDVTISPTAYILGPAVIGDGCTIEDHAQIVGPAAIGPGSRIAQGALVRESVVWDRSVVLGGARVEYSIVTDQCTIQQEQSLSRALMVSKEGAAEQTVVLSSIDRNGMSAVANRPQLLAPPPSVTLRRSAYLLAKRCLDIAVSVAAVVLLTPVFVLIACLIRKDSPGPVLFRQKRCGKNGKVFTMYKFRTMVADAVKIQSEFTTKQDVDGPMFKIKQDPRVTRVGRFLRNTSLDELPQFLNVIKSDMSLVGPRPLIMSEMAFAPHWRDIRLQVKPGVTGLWQVNGRSDSSFHSWIRNDISYVQRQSFLLDLRIIAKTVGVLIKRAGAC